VLRDAVLAFPRPRRFPPHRSPRRPRGGDARAGSRGLLPDLGRNPGRRRRRLARRGRHALRLPRQPLRPLRDRSAGRHRARPLRAAIGDRPLVGALRGPHRSGRGAALAFLAALVARDRAARAPPGASLAEGANAIEAVSEKRTRAEPKRASALLAKRVRATSPSWSPGALIAAVFTTSMCASMRALHFNGRARALPQAPARFPAPLSCLQSDFL